MIWYSSPNGLKHVPACFHLYFSLLKSMNGSFSAILENNIVSDLDSAIVSLFPHSGLCFKQNSKTAPIVTDQCSWPPQSVEISKRTDKKFRQDFTGTLPQQGRVKTNNSISKLIPWGEGAGSLYGVRVEVDLGVGPEARLG